MIIVLYRLPQLLWLTVNSLFFSQNKKRHYSTKLLPTSHKKEGDRPWPKLAKASVKKLASQKAWENLMESQNEGRCSCIFLRLCGSVSGYTSWINIFTVHGVLAWWRTVNNELRISFNQNLLPTTVNRMSQAITYHLLLENRVLYSNNKIIE